MSADTVPGLTGMMSLGLIFCATDFLLFSGGQGFWFIPLWQVPVFQGGRLPFRVGFSFRGFSPGFRPVFTPVFHRFSGGFPPVFHAI